MTVYIEIESTNTTQRTNRKTGNVSTLQEAYVHGLVENGQPSKYPRRTDVYVPTENGQAVPYQPGKYLIDDSSYRMNQWGSLELGFINLKAAPVQSAKKAG
jgi:hypothetical protein